MNRKSDIILDSLKRKDQLQLIGIYAGLLCQVDGSVHEVADVTQILLVLTRF